MHKLAWGHRYNSHPCSEPDVLTAGVACKYLGSTHPGRWKQWSIIVDVGRSESDPDSDVKRNIPWNRITMIL